MPQHLAQNLSNTNRNADAYTNHSVDKVQSGRSSTHKKTAPKKKRKKTSFAHDLSFLLVKIGIVICVFIVLFTFVFGIFRVNDPSMTPTLKPGDLVLTYRLNSDINFHDVVAYEYHNETTFGRVVARAGDTVDITDSGLLVNGTPQEEEGIYSPTTQFEGGTTMPLTVPDGQVFVLGDNRANATDSRIIGCINTSDLEGVVMSELRTRRI